jgi:hypothetical protein
LVFAYLTDITGANENDISIDTASDTSSIRLWPYTMSDKLFYFEHRRTKYTNASEIQTTIFSGKLFLMLKYYVCRIYKFMPKILAPDWFEILDELHESG